MTPTQLNYSLENGNLTQPPAEENISKKKSVCLAGGIQNHVILGCGHCKEHKSGGGIPAVRGGMSEALITLGSEIFLIDKYIYIYR